VLDSFAVLAFLFREKGHEKVLARLETAAEEEDTLLVAAPNWAEVRYMVERKAGIARWPETRQKLLALPLVVVTADQALAEQAGGIKAVSRMSLADCFAAALAKLKGSEVYTGDPEFRAVEREIRIVWL
jgi:predicted nucleic acid-binding protein